MATKNGQSKLHWRISFGISFALILGTTASAGDIDPSRYSPFSGDRFYLLSETTFSPSETALVRIEIPGKKNVVAAYSGVDVRLYKIPQPIEFLRRQKDLHRPNTKSNYGGEGVSNAISYLWDSWYKKSRLVWQRIVSSPVRQKAVKQNPDLKQTPAHTYQTVPDNNPQFKPIAGLKLVEQFRYPLWDAKPIEPPQGVALVGSSSNFLQVKEGNTYIPVGNQKPGLYLVEAMIGSFRATTLLFIADTIAITKLSSQQELIWTVDKKNGMPAPGTNIIFSDGAGVIGKGTTGSDGLYTFKGKGLEKSYVIGEDKKGGVFISENFYYDSEIYGTKLYTFTDRPIYRPGDIVNIKIFGREFYESSKSAQIPNGLVTISVVDPEGTVLINKKAELSIQNSGGNTSFKLPEFSRPGGYNLQINYQQTQFTSAFRVANYVKPHFEIDIGFEKQEYKVDEGITGKLSLNYSNGDPVKDSKVEIEVRKQRLTIVEGELEYVDKFPIRVSKENILTDSSGATKFEIPPTTEPSRLIVSVRATDSASYRVIATKEILVQTTAAPLSLKSEHQFSKPNESVYFKIGKVSAESTSVDNFLVAWEAIRLQDQSKFSGGIDNQKGFSIVFEKSGAYTILAKGKNGLNVSATNHWVQGAELASMPGSISVVTDKAEYEPNDMAHILLTFPEDIHEALVTLERDQVEHSTLISNSSSWIRIKKISNREYSADIPIQENFGPNITLSIAYASNGRYYFENKGIKVTIPKINISFKPEKLIYKPGETVNVSITTNIRNKPVSASLAISVVDEMIYLLQPEIAPDISDFFFHPRRNQVRTSSSLNFHSYDVAVSATGASPSTSAQYGERSLKLRERPRREDKDTAFWAPKLKTDAAGNAKFSFVMPDSLTRWRMTARAISVTGQVGQKKDYISSQKDVYVKWTGPSQYRVGDSPVASVAFFNLTKFEKKLTLETRGYGKPISKQLRLKPGTSYVQIPLQAESDGKLTLVLSEKKKVLDELSIEIKVSPRNWLTLQSVHLTSKSNAVPSGAFNLRLSTANDTSESLLRAVDYLVDYPYGCVEQTSSRILPLSLALSQIKQFGYSAGVIDKLTNRISFDRLRLIKMAGPEAMFSWWGESTKTSAFMTVYAYYADWMASKALNISLPKAHWDYALESYKKYSVEEPMLNRVLILWMLNEMGLPTKTIAEGILETWSDAKDQNPMFGTDSTMNNLTAVMLLSIVATKNNLTMPSKFTAEIASAKTSALQGSSPMLTGAYILSKYGTQLSDSESALAKSILNNLLPQNPTVDRSFALAFIFKALTPSAKKLTIPSQSLGKEWSQINTTLGRPVWQYRGRAKLKSIPISTFTADSSLHLTYESFRDESSGLPIQIERKLYKLTKQSNSADTSVEYKMEPLTAAWELSTKDIYLDEITISPQSGSYHFGLLEMALPPGGSIEQSTWGMTLKEEGGSVVSIDSGNFQDGNHSYSVPIEKLDEPKTFRHLVRFSQPGTFTIPPARYFSMYSPVKKAFEGGASSANKKIVLH